MYINYRCNAPVGLYEGKSTLYITLQFPGCDDIGVILHEMMHVVGFNHEQNRWDRNKYIKVLFNNIKEEFRFAFEIVRINNHIYYKSIFIIVYVKYI